MVRGDPSSPRTTSLNGSDSGDSRRGNPTGHTHTATPSTRPRLHPTGCEHDATPPREPQGEPSKNQSFAVTASSRWAKRSRACSRRLGRYSLGTPSAGASYPRSS